jgi:hypothetical protein
MTRHAVRLIVRLLLLVLAGLVVLVVGSAVGIFTQSGFFGSGKASADGSAATCQISVNGGAAGGFAAFVNLMGAKVSLLDFTGTIGTGGGAQTLNQGLALNNSGTLAACTLDTGISVQPTLGNTNTTLNTIVFEANSGTSQDVVFDQISADSSQVWPCLTSIQGFMSSGVTANGIMEIDAGTSGLDNVTVGSDGINLNAGGCSVEGAPSGIAQYIVQAAGSDTLSALGTGGTAPTATPVKFVATSTATTTSIPAETQTFKAASPGTVLDLSQVNVCTAANCSAFQINTLSTGTTPFQASQTQENCNVFFCTFVTESFSFQTGGSNVTNINGPKVGTATFIAGSQSGYTFSDPGNGANKDIADFSQAASINANLSTGTTGTVAVAGGNDTLSNIYTIIGSNLGSNQFTAGPTTNLYTFDAAGNSNTFTGGAGTDSFVAANPSAPTAFGLNNVFKLGSGQATITGGTGTGDTVDFSAVTNAVDVNLNPPTLAPTAVPNGTGSINYFTATAASTPKTFYYFNAATPLTIDGAGGGTTFQAGLASSGYTFVGTAGTNTADFSAASSGITANLSVTPSTVAVPTGGNDNISNIQDVVGAATGGNTFIGGSSAVTFESAGGGNTFRAGTGSETLKSPNTPPANPTPFPKNTVDFSALTVPVAVNVSGATENLHTGSLPNNEAAAGSATYDFTSFVFTPIHGGITNPAASFTGSPAGSTFFAGAAPGYTFTGNGGNPVADFSAAPAGTEFDLSAYPQVAVTLGGTPSPGGDTLSNIADIDGSTAGSNTFVAGTGSNETFGDNGTASSDTIDFANVGTSSSAPLTVNVSGGPVSTSSGPLASYSAAVGSTLYSFTNPGVAAQDFTTLIGSNLGNTDFLAGGGSNYEFCTPALTTPPTPKCSGDVNPPQSNVQPSDTVDFSSVSTTANSPLEISLATGPSTGVVHLPSGATDKVEGFITLVGSLSGNTIFDSGPTTSATYSLTAPGNGNTFRAGQGNANFKGSGSNNTVDFSGTGTNPVTVNVSGGQVGQVQNGTATAGSFTYSFTDFENSPTTFDGGKAGTTFIAGSTGDTFNGYSATPPVPNILTFADATGTSLVFCDAITAHTPVSCNTLNQTSAVLGSVQEPFSNITVFNSLLAGNTTFVGGTSGNNQVNATGTNNAANYAAATQGVTANLFVSPVTVSLPSISSSASDTLAGITSVVGSYNGGNTFIAGSSAETFADPGLSTNSDTIDFNHVGTSASTPLFVNVSGGPATTTAGTVTNYTAQVAGTIYNFANSGNGAVFNVLQGAGSGNTSYLAGSTGGYKLCATDSGSPCGTTVVPTDSVDFSSATSGVKIDMSNGPNNAMVTVPVGPPDALYGITSATGSLAGGNTFKGGAPTISVPSYAFNGPGNSNDFVAGFGSDNFLGSGVFNTVDFSNVSLSVVNVSGQQVGSVVNGDAVSSSNVTYNFQGFATQPTTFIAGTSASFLAGGAADTFEGSGSTNDTLSFADAFGSGLNVDVTNGRSCPTPRGPLAPGTAGTATFGALTEQFCGISTFDGLPNGSSTFNDPGTGGYTFNGAGSNNVTNFSGAPSGAAQVNLHTTPATAAFTGGGLDKFTGVTTVFGTNTGSPATPNVFTVGTGPATIGAGGTGNAIDFSNVATSASTPLIVNLTSTQTGSTNSNTATAGSTTYDFTSGGATFMTFIGPQSGNTRFVANAGRGGYTFCASGSGSTCTVGATQPGDVTDFSGNLTGITTVMSGQPNCNEGFVGLGVAPGAPSQTCPASTPPIPASEDWISGITTVVGSTSRSNTFDGGLQDNTFSSTAPNNTLSYVNASSPLFADLTADSISGIDNFSLPNGTLTLQGSSFNDDFKLGKQAVKLEGGGGQDSIDLSGISPTTGLAVNLSGGSITGPGTNGVSFNVNPLVSGIATPACTSPVPATQSALAQGVCVTGVIGTSGSDLFTVNTSTPTLTISGNGTLDLSQVPGPASVNMPSTLNSFTGTVISPQISFSGISNVLGTAGGGDHFFAGTGSEKVTESGALGTLDFSNEPTSGTSGIGVVTTDNAGTFQGTVTSGSPSILGLNATDTFTGIQTFIGTPGNDTFTQNGGSPPGGYTFDGRKGNNELDLTNAGISNPLVSLTDSNGCDAANNNGTVTAPGFSDSFKCIATVLGPGAIYKVSPGQTGTSTINGGGSGTLELVGDTSGIGATINLTSLTVTGAGYNLNFSGMSTVDGTGLNDLFVDGPGNYKLVETGGSNGISFATAPGPATVNLSTMPYTPAGASAVAPGSATVSNGLGGTWSSLSLQGISNVIGTNQFNDVMVAGPGYGTFTGGQGADTFVPTGGGEFIYGGTGGSTLDLSLLPSSASLNLASTLPQSLGTNDGTMQVVPGTISKVITPNAGGRIYAGPGNVILQGRGTGPETLIGGMGSDTLIGGGGSSTLVAGVGNDILEGGSGQTTFVPGQGTDTLSSPNTSGNILSYNGVQSAAEVNLSNQLYTVPNGLPFGGMSVPPMTATGGAGATVSLSGAGISEVVGSAAGDLFETGGGDIIFGNGGNDMFVVLNGNNNLNAANGSSSLFLFAGPGSNLINGGGASTVDFAPGTQSVSVHLPTGSMLTGSATGGFPSSNQSLTGILNAVGTNQKGDILVAGIAGGFITDGTGTSDLLQSGPQGGNTMTAFGDDATFCAQSGCGSGSTPGGGNHMYGQTGQDDTYFAFNGVTDWIYGNSTGNAFVDPSDQVFGGVNNLVQ